LKFVFTEQGTAWIPEQLMTLDAYYRRMAPPADHKSMSGARS